MSQTARERLLSAIETLLRHKSLDAVSVREISEQAGVCRKTFYRNFQDKYALAAAYFEDFFDRSFGLIVSGESFDAALLRYLELCEQKSAVLKNAYSSMDVNGLRNIDIAYTRRTYQSFLTSRGADIGGADMSFAVEIAVRGGTDMVIDWLMHDMPIDKHRLCALIRRTLPADLLEYL